MTSRLNNGGEGEFPSARIKPDRNFARPVMSLVDSLWHCPKPEPGCETSSCAFSIRPGDPVNSYIARAYLYAVLRFRITLFSKWSALQQPLRQEHPFRGPQWLLPDGRRFKSTVSVPPHLSRLLIYFSWFTCYYVLYRCATAVPPLRAGGLTEPTAPYM